MMTDSSTVAELIKKSVFEANFKKAVQYIDAALDIEPNNADALYLKCNLLYKEGKYQKAYDVSSKMVDLKFKNAEGWYIRGCIAEKLNRKSLAIKYYKRAIQFDPHNKDALYRFLELNNYSKSCSKYFILATEADPSDINLWVKLIDFLIEDGQCSKAITEIKKASEYHPECAMLNHLEKKANVQLKNPKKNNSKSQKKTKKKEKEKEKSAKKNLKNVKKEKTKQFEDVSAKWNETKDIIPNGTYGDWDPPAPVTIYCRMQNVSYNMYKYYRTRASGEIKIRNIEEHLNPQTFNCTHCVFEFQLKCNYKNKYVSPVTICKHFKPEKGMLLVNEKLTKKQKRVFNCSYCKTTSNSYHEHLEHMRKKHPRKFKEKYPHKI